MCDEFATDMALLAAGKLPEVRRFAAEAHLGDCPTCRADLASWRQVAAAVALQQAKRAPSLPPYIPTTEPAPVPSPIAWTGRLLVSLVVGLLLWAAWLGWPGPSSRPIGSSGDDGQAVRPAATERRRAPPVLRRAAPAVALVPADIPASSVAVGPPPPRAAVIAPEGGAVTAGRSQPTAMPAGFVVTSRPISPPAGIATVTVPAPAEPTGVVPEEPQPASTPEPEERSTEVPPATATLPAALVAGVVTGSDGLPRAEVRVVARAWHGSMIEAVRSGVDGRYSLNLGAGRWALSAEAPAYAAQWYPSRLDPLSASLIEGAAGSMTSADFVVVAAPDGRIEGVVLDADGNPVPGALVAAAPASDGEPSVGRLASAVIADAAGAYRLAVSAGAWHVAAASDWRGKGLLWWRGAESSAAADTVNVPGDGTTVTLTLHVSTAAP